ncbi:hypothetical protein SDRG_02523 [Saprolegnia diclina VS20]|uniref:EGF-like domain-containing protein n=1 Tax=Saprolegnia diclina (strain VS20) TaxID=1156394 RepID=T0R0L8_SAPDV|nr:hypothetical protein SDRG_02523 [Saprolegnia diclina VS20]EQC39865.1 hypothetical protein SDRG_02523 [Saprolegnia diclina VS20]|eukprot:XP_008606339.1 hypothetical protein SDRG_02523 [Saprolegnia diclina VS20]
MSNISSRVSISVTATTTWGNSAPAILVLTGKDACAPTSIDWWREINGSFASSCPECETTPAHSSYAAAPNRFLAETNATVLSTVVDGGEVGHINTTLAYQPNAYVSWLILPSSPDVSVLLHVYAFEMECDNDKVAFFEVHQNGSEQLMWQGGCARPPFTLQSRAPGIGLRMILATDDSIQLSGVHLRYHGVRGVSLDALTIPCPTSCGRYGLCRDDGTCDCRPRFSGEGCTNHDVCPHHPACYRPDSIVVDERFGSDTLGTGGLRQNKALQSLTRALELVPPNGTIVLYPGTYTDARTCNVVLEHQHVTITSLVSTAWSDSDLFAISMPDSALVVDVNCTGALASWDIRKASVVRLSSLRLIGGIGPSARLQVADSQVVLTHVSVRGAVSSSLGGGLAAANSELVFSDVDIEDCVATTGGGVYLEHSSLKATTSSISHNTATSDGGGVSLYSSTLHGARVALNTAARYGGGIAVTGVDNNLWNGTVFNNSAGGGGGLAVLSAASLVMERIRILGNTAITGGGLLLLSTQSLSVGNTTVALNTAVQGGGLALQSLSNSSFDVSELALFENHAADTGGGLYVHASSVLLDGLFVARCTSNGTGGGLAAHNSNMGLLNTTIVNNSAATSGGGLFGFNSTIAGATVAIRSNAASVGGGMCLLTSRVKSMHIITNSARLDGGGVAASNSSYLADLVLAANQAARDGGGLHLSGWISIQNTSVLDSCAQQRGGGAFVTPSSTVACSGLVLDANTADDGGGAYLDGPDIALRGTCATTRNRARVAGGGITCSKSCQLDGPRLLRNSADTLGGGFLCTNGSCTVRNGRLQGNRAMRGGGLGAHYATVSLERCNITFNSALVTGGGISAQNSSVRLFETRVTSCSATESGGGLALADATVLGANASIFNNTAHRFGGNVVGTSCSIINLTIENGSAAHGGGVAILQGGASTVTSVSLYKNVARQTGGGLYIQNATVHHTNTAIVDNLAPRGASVALTGASAFLGAATTQYLATTILTATRSSSGHVYVAPHTTAVVSAVHISYGAAQHGGGLYIDVNSSFAGDRIVLEKNIAVAGGGIYAASSARVALANVTLQDNVADDGGGMYVVGAHLSLQRVVMMANFANATGGAIALINSSSAAFSCAFSSNTARDRGGAIALIAASRFALTSTRLTANAASNGGSVALCGFSTVTLTNCSVRGGDTTSFLGGLVYADASTVILEASTRLANGVATRGGAVYLTNAASMYCHTVQLTLNVATRDGGGIFATGNATSVELQCTFVDANRAEGCGGGVYLDAGAVLLMAGNSSIRNNFARSHGGGIYLHGALSTAAQLYGSNVLGNNATGHGGGIFAGHGSQLVVIDTQVLRNYGQHSGGGLFATTAKVTCVHATFANNSATTGGGVFLDRTSSLHSLASIFSLNTAETTGGALVLASRSVGAIVNCTFTTNVAAAGNGGAIALERAAQGTLLECVATNNSSPNGMGGGLFASHSARVSDTGSRWTLNTAKDGAAMALVSPGPHQTINATFFMNAAQRQGGGLYLDKGAEMSAFTSLVVLNNSAMSGGGIFWVVDPPSGAHFFCDNCSLDNNEPTDVATSAVSVRVKAWPSSFSSDVPLTVGGNASAYVASALLTSPFSWATVQTTDYYGHVARLDNATTCTLSASAAGLALAPRGATYSAVNGLVTFARAAIQGPIVVAAVPVSVVVDCSRLGASMIPLQIDMLMTPCAPGYSTDAAGRCVRCPSGQYSLNGTACFSCPPGAVCSEYILTTGTPALVGVAHPRTLPNYYLDRAPATHVTTQCDPLNWPSRDPCRAFALSSDDMEAALTQCLTSVVPVTYVASWPPMREFMCLSGLAFYPCQVENVCLGNIDSLLGHACAVGYAGSLCGRCASGYSNTISGTCQYCNGKWTSLTWQNALAPCLGLVVLACLIGALRLYLIDGSERELLRQAKLDQQLKARTKQRLTWWASARSNCHKKYLAWQARRRPQAPPRDVFGITLDTDGRPDYVSVYLEKAKILTGFFQIFGNFRTTYAIAWPPAINDAMVATSQFSLDLVAIAGIDCFMPSTSFYVQFISTLAVLAFIFALVFIFYYRGAAHYIGKLKTIPRCCPRCGLPVWDKYVPDMAQRRPSMPQPLSGSRQKRRRQSLEQRASTLLSLDDVSSAHGTIAARRVLTALRALLTEPDPHTSRARQLQREAINMSTAKAYTGALPMYRPTHRVCPAKPLTAHVRSRVLRSNLCVWQARVKLRLHYQSYRIKCVKVMLGILLLLYPMVSRNFLLVFHCDQVGARYWLVKDRSLECYTTEWSLYACVALAGVGVWVVGVPFLFWRLVYKARHRHIDTRLTLLESRAYRPLREKWLAEMRTMLAAEGRCVPLALGRRDEMAYLGHYMKTKNLEDSAVMARLGLIYQNYKSEFWWFDVFDLIRKVLLNGVLVFLQGNDIVQSTSGLALCLLALTLTLQCKPYRSWTDSLVAGVTQFQLFITLFLGFLLLMNTASTTALTPVVAMVDVYTISLLLVATNLASIVVAAGVLLHDTIRNRRRVRKVRAVRRAALISAAVRKLWRRAYNHAVGIAYANRPAPLSVALLIQRARRQPPPQTQDA